MSKQQGYNFSVPMHLLGAWGTTVTGGGVPKEQLD